MKQFMAIMLGKPNGKQDWDQLDEKTRQERMKKGSDAWTQWMMKNQKAVVVSGGPLGKTKKTSKNGLEDTKNLLSAYTVVQAETHEDAAKMFLEHPHFMIFPGDSIEIMECLPIPKV